MKPLWKADVVEYVHELCVLYTEDDNEIEAGHYEAVKSIGKIFGTKNYCFGVSHLIITIRYEESNYI